MMKPADVIHITCVAFVKRKQGGFIDPRDTSYEALSKSLKQYVLEKFPNYSDQNRIESMSYRDRCVIYANKLKLLADEGILGSMKQKGSKYIRSLERKGGRLFGEDQQERQECHHGLKNDDPYDQLSGVDMRHPPW